MCLEVDLLCSKVPFLALILCYKYGRCNQLGKLGEGIGLYYIFATSCEPIIILKFNNSKWKKGYKNSVHITGKEITGLTRTLPYILHHQV